MLDEIYRRGPEVEELAFDMILDGKSLDDIAQAMGLGTRRRFQKYMIKFEDFSQMMERARLAECQYLEEQMLSVCTDYSDKYAKIQLEALAKILKFRDPKRYGDKMNVDVAMSVDISGALSRAEKRLIDVTNVIALPVAVRDNSPDAG